MTQNLETITERKRAFGEAICVKIGENIAKLSFTDEVNLKPPNYSEAKFTLVTDPFTQSQDLVGYWYDNRQQRIGQIRFHGDGSFYAEYDVAQPYSLEPKFFVEAINAWGNESNIKTEPKLLPLPS